ncbi:6469_t:CDS:1, partial [Racocetra persica]
GRILSKRIKRQHEKAKKYIYDEDGIIIEKIYTKKRKINKFNYQYEELKNIEQKELDLELYNSSELKLLNQFEQYKKLEL